MFSETMKGSESSIYDRDDAIILDFYIQQFLSDLQGATMDKIGDRLLGPLNITFVGDSKTCYLILV